MKIKFSAIGGIWSPKFSEDVNRICMEHNVTFLYRDGYYLRTPGTHKIDVAPTQRLSSVPFLEDGYAFFAHGELPEYPFDMHFHLNYNAGGYERGWGHSEPRVFVYQRRVARPETLEQAKARADEVVKEWLLGNTLEGLLHERIVLALERTGDYDPMLAAALCLHFADMTRLQLKEPT